MCRQKAAYHSLVSGRPLPLAEVAHNGKQRQADSLDVTQMVLPDYAACEGFFGRLKTELF